MSSGVTSSQSKDIGVHMVVQQHYYHLNDDMQGRFLDETDGEVDICDELQYHQTTSS